MPARRSNMGVPFSSSSALVCFDRLDESIDDSVANLPGFQAVGVDDSNSAVSHGQPDDGSPCIDGTAIWSSCWSVTVVVGDVFPTELGLVVGVSDRCCTPTHTFKGRCLVVSWVHHVVVPASWHNQVRAFQGPQQECECLRAEVPSTLSSAVT